MNRYLRMIRYNITNFKMKYTRFWVTNLIHLLINKLIETLYSIVYKVNLMLIIKICKF